jgi:flagellar protein FlaJ
MGFYTKLAMKLFHQTGDKVISYFSDIIPDIKKSKMKTTPQEYMSIALLTSFIVFLFELPIWALIVAIFVQSIMFSIFLSFMLSSLLAAVFFMAFVNYPKLITKDRAKSIDDNLPFATLYMTTISGSKLPLYKVLKIFSKFAKYGEFTDEINSINSDVEVFGLDINTALTRAIDRTSSKNFKEFLYGLLSLSSTGGDIHQYIKDKSKSLMAEHRRRLYEFSHQLMVFTEVYLTAIVLGAIFFTVLTSILSSISMGSTGGGNTILLQFLLIFIFLPAVTAVFIILIKSATPGGD